MNQEDFDHEYGFISKDTQKEVHSQTQKRGFRQRFASKCGPSALLKTLLGFFPIVTWLPKYDIKANLLSDIIGGLTVGILHIPQSMGYAGLAGLPPVYGLYTSFFPPLIYMLMGTSRHVSLGTFAVVDLMVGGVRYRILPENQHMKMASPLANSSRNILSIKSIFTTSTTTTTISPASMLSEVSTMQSMDPTLTPVNVVTALSFMVGVVLLCMALLRLDFTTAYLSEQLIGGFTTGASVHVLTSQLNLVMGVKLPRYTGPGKLIYTYRDLITCIPDSNPATLIVSAVTIVCLAIGKECINPIVRKKSPVAVPFELIAVLVGTAVSYFADFYDTYDITIVEHIPTGLPTPKLPPFGLISQLIGDAIGIAIVIFAVEISLCRFFATRHNYEVEPRQELYALGVLEVIVSTLSVYPSSTGLARSLVYEGAGTKTQVASIFSSGLLLVVLLWLAPLFETLPKCVLASIIIVALKGMFMQFKQLRYLWPVSKVDFSIWVVGFVATVLVDVKEGLAIGVGFALFTVIYRLQRPHSVTLERVNGDDETIYKNKERYSKTEEHSEVKVFRMEASLIFVNTELFKEKLYHRYGIDIYKAQKQVKQRRDELNNPEAKAASTRVHIESAENGAEVHHSSEQQERSALTSPDSNQSPTTTTKADQELRPKTYPFAIIIDCSTFNCIDVAGMTCLKKVYQELNSIGVTLLLAGTNSHIRDMFSVGGFYDTVPKSTLYASLHDAFTSSLAQLRNSVCVDENSPTISIGAVPSDHNSPESIDSKVANV